MSIDDPLERDDDAEECAAARHFRSLIQAGTVSPVTGGLDPVYFANLRRKLREAVAGS